MKSAGGFKGSMMKIQGAVTSTGAKIISGLGAAGVVKWLAGSIGAAQTAQASQMALANTVNKTGGSWKAQGAAITDLLGKSSALSGYTKGELRGGMTQLITTTGKVGASQKLLGVTMDLARRKGLDVGKAATLVGRAYNGNIMQLKRMGIELPKGTKGMAAIDALQKRVAGSAKTYGDSAAGAQDKFKNALAALQVKVGTALLPVFTKLTTMLSGLVTKFSNLPGPVQNVILGIAGFAGAAAMLAPFMTSIASVIGIFKGMQIATQLVTAAQWLWNIALSANPIGIIIMAVVALVAVIVLLWTKNAAFRNFIIGVWGAIKGAAMAVWNFLVGAFKKWGLKILLFLTGPIGLIVLLVVKYWAQIKAAAIAVWNWLVGIFKKYGLQILIAITGPVGLLVIALVRNWGKIKSGASAAWSAVVGFFRSAPGRIWAALGNLGKMLFDAGNQIIQGLIDGLKNAWKRAADWFSGLADKIKALKGPMPKDSMLLFDAGKAIIRSLGLGASSAWPQIAAQLAGYTGQLGGYGGPSPAFAGVGGSVSAYSRTSAGSRAPIYIAKIELPHVTDARSFASELDTLRDELAQR